LGVGRRTKKKRHDGSCHQAQPRNLHVFPRNARSGRPLSLTPC
jgi:hypothetical protein